MWGAAAVLIVWLLGRWGVVDRRPLLVWAVAGAATGLVVAATDALQGRHPSRRTMHGRVATDALSVTVWVYLLGWGPALALGYAFAVLPNAFRFGSRARWAVVAWPVGCLAAAQLVVAIAGVALNVSARAADGLAAVDAVALVFASLFAARLVAGKEQAERRLAHAAAHDDLTGLMTRATFRHRLERRLSGHRRQDRSGRPVAVLFCDLVNFKAVNDRLGHDAGDRVLGEVARRMAATLRDGDLLGRFAGDEFVVGLCPADGRSAAVAAAERLLEALEWPIDAGGVPVRMGVSVGIVYSPTGDVPVDDLLTGADGAMYRAKAARRSAWSLLEVA